MDEPTIAGKRPAVLTLEPGKYFWCACGRSQRQPFCDGSHAGTDYMPEVVKIEEKTRVAWCGCKRTGNEPFCDGSHARLA